MHYLARYLGKRWILNVSALPLKRKWKLSKQPLTMHQKRHYVEKGSTTAETKKLFAIFCEIKQKAKYSLFAWQYDLKAISRKSAFDTKGISNWYNKVLRRSLLDPCRFSFPSSSLKLHLSKAAYSHSASDFRSLVMPVHFSTVKKPPSSHTKSPILFLDQIDSALDFPL